MKYAYMLLLALFVLSACTTQQSPETMQTYECPDGSIVTDLAECSAPEQEQTAQEEEEIEQTSEPVEQQTPSELIELREKAENRQSSGYSFTYITTGSADDAIISDANVRVKEDKVLFSLVERMSVEGFEATHILIESGQATAYCVDCRGGPEPYSVDAPEIVLPLDWLAGIEQADFTGQQRTDGRNSYRMVGTALGYDVEMYIDIFSGIPLEVIYEDARIRYRGLGLGVSDSTFDI